MIDTKTKIIVGRKATSPFINERLEDLELHAVDVTHVHGLASRSVHPEEVPRIASLVRD